VLSQYYWEKDPAFKEKLKETAFQKWPYYLDKFEAQVKKNGGYFVGGKVINFDYVPSYLFDLIASIIVNKRKYIFVVVAVVGRFPVGCIF